MPSTRIDTSRFGAVEIDSTDVLAFPGGMLGLEDCSEWVLLADAQNEALGWLQSITRADVALAVVSPRRFVPDYQVRLPQGELAELGLDAAAPLPLLVIVGAGEHGLTLNLKAPLVINRARRLGRQVIAGGEQPLKHELIFDPPTPKKRSA